MLGDRRYNAGTMFGLRTLSVAVASLAVLSTAAASDPYFGPEIGLFLPASAELREALGESWFSAGVARVARNERNRNLVTTDWNVISKDHAGSRLFILTPSMGMVMPLGSRNGGGQLFLAGRVGVSYMDYAITMGSGERRSGKAFGANANAELGVQLGDRLTLSVRYDVFSERDGLTFDGLSLSARFGLVRF